ncbi:MAG: aspartate aminotransferase family protein [Anaerolineae bacterium]
MSPRHPEGHVFYRKMWHDYPCITHAEGIYLIDDKGRRYLDAAGGAIVVNVGFGVRAIADAIAEQAWLVAYVHADKFTTPVLEEYANELAKVVPIPGARFFPLTTGSEANEAAIKLARQVQLIRGQPDRHIVIGRWRSYHGITLGTLAIGGRMGARERFRPMMHDMPHVMPPTCYRCPLDKQYPSCNIACAEMLEIAIAEHGARHIAAFIAEPVSGSALAATVPPPEYWPRIREICDKYGILLIADEVMCGFGRTGKWCAFEHFGFTPDILTMGKGLAGGVFPLSMMVARGDIVDELYQAGQDIAHGGTFSHHAVGAAAGLATLRFLQEHNLVEEAARKGELLGQMLREKLSDLPGVGNIRGLGLLWGVEFVENKTTHEAFEMEQNIATRVFDHARALGLMLYPGRGGADGLSGDAIMLGPPAIISEQEMEQVVDLLAEAIKRTFEPSPPVKP